MITTVVNMRREKYDVYIGRPSKWGNPFTHHRVSSTLAQWQVGSREEAIAKYREWIQTQPILMAALEELRGKRLGCYCAPFSCHGHVLAELADGFTRRK